MRRTPEALSHAQSALDERALRRQRLIVQEVEECAAARGQRLINFCSNDYLGLARHDAVSLAAQRALEQYGTGSGASHLVTGHGREHAALEEELAAFTGRERALLFSTGYMANLGVISTFAARGEVVLQDRLNHASLLDGVRISGARLRRYAHADAADAARCMAATPRASLLATDGVFSMDGDVAPLPLLAQVARAAQAWLLVDDAHGFGVLGARGAGSLDAAQLGADAVPLYMATLGKALGSFGAFVAGDADVIEHLMQHARSYIYTTALPPSIAAATRAALEQVQAEPWRRARVLQHVAYWRRGLIERELPHSHSATPIQPLIVGDSGSALRLCEALLERGLWIAAIRPPTVPPGTARLRVCLSAAHETAELDRLLDALHELYVPAAVEA